MDLAELVLGHHTAAKERMSRQRGQGASCHGACHWLEIENLGLTDIGPSLYFPNPPHNKNVLLQFNIKPT